LHPNGAIHTDIVFDDGQRIVIKATVWRDLADPMPAGIDYAEEILTDRGVNATSRIENCATSATGRAISIAASGLGPSDWTKKPSREEMAKVERRGGQPAQYGNKPAGVASEKQRQFIADLLAKRKPPMVAQLPSDLSFADASKLIESLKRGELPAMLIDDEEVPF
jgi:hypothetical protein